MTAQCRILCAGAFGCAMLIPAIGLGQADAERNEERERQNQSQNQSTRDGASDTRTNKNKKKNNEEEEDRAQQHLDQNQNQNRDRESDTRDRNDRFRENDRRQRDANRIDGRDGRRGADAWRRERDNRGRDDFGWIGLSVSDDTGQGLVIRHVAVGSPAQMAGLRPGDRITRVNNRQVQSLSDFHSRIAECEGERIEIEADRNRIERAYIVQVLSRDEALRRRPGQFDQYGSQYRQYGQSGYPGQFGQFEHTSGYRSDQILVRQIDGLERQIERLSDELDELRQAVNRHADSRRFDDGRTSRRSDQGRQLDYFDGQRRQREEYRSSRDDDRDDGKFDRERDDQSNQSDRPTSENQRKYDDGDRQIDNTRN